MRKLLLVTLVACGSASGPAITPAPAEPTSQAAPHPEVAMPSSPTPTHPWPHSRTVDVAETIHGKTIRDPYRWLEDETAPEVQAWMTSEDDYARGVLATLPGRDELATRLTQLFYFDAVGAPTHRHGRYFFTRRHADKEKSIVYWKQGPNDKDGVEHVLFDPNTWSADSSKGLHGWYPSWDGARVAYQVSEHNSDETVMHVIDVATGKDTADVIPGTKYSGASWTPDNKGFYYVWVPPVGNGVGVAERPGFAELRFHALGSDPASDPIIHEATKNPETFLGGGISRDGHWLFCTVQHGWNSSDVFFRDAHKPGPWQPLVTGVDANFSLVAVYKDKLYIHTNDGAPRYRIMVADPHKPDRAAWKELVPQSDATMETAGIVGGHLAVTYLDHASSKLSVFALDGKHVRDVALPGIGTSSGLSGDEDEDTAYFEYTSFTEPQIIFKTSVATGKTSEWARIKLPIDTSGFVTDQVFYPSKDGTKISMFVIHRKDVKLDGTNPTILYGYGGFSVSMSPGYASSRMVWLEHGGVYAIPNLRGGGEYGEEWHKAGMRLAKQNVFDDFIAAAQYLIDQKWTSKQHLAIAGGSNGGLLVGATVAERPDLVKAVICAVPLLDMLRFHLFGSGKTWVPEYGSAEDPQEFAALYAYSPYRIAVDAGPRAYPAILFDSADHDDRVDPMHARKLAAVIQADQTADAPILLRIERNSGHGGADMVKSQVDRYADQFAFLLHELSVPSAKRED
ncbi:MAG TPA: prolyl oligopeptidase family serine peptidase [Kofleriaceae bacterium]|jgi:prolyl oligopeptidase|nr:prolyl oligopeptidase family serine peptidase [Kofleriaceae bacterium]